MTTLPNNNPIINIASMGFKYLVDPTTLPINASLLTNVVDTTINIAYLSMVTSAVPAYVKVNDEITYTITLTNIGNVSANNVVVIDTIPKDTTLVPNSVYIDNVSIPNGNPDSPYGINLGTIPNGVTSTLQFKVTVNTIPSLGEIKNNSAVIFKYTVDPSVPNGRDNNNNSNPTVTKVMQATVDNLNGGGFAHRVSTKYAKVDDILTYTISFKNTGNTPANDVILVDTTPADTTFITDSLTFNGVTMPGLDLTSPGVNIGSLLPNTLSTLSFKVKVDTIPSINPIVNNASIKFTYTVDPSLPNSIISGGNSNSQETQINQATIDNGYGAGFIKSSSPSYLKVGDNITYTLILKNTGNTQATNILIKDTIPDGTSFISNSVLVNDITIPAANPATSGIGIPPLNASSVSTVQFKVIVNTIPTINPIPNNARLTFKFTVDPSVPNGASSLGNSNTVVNQVNQAIIDNVVGGGLVESVNAPYGKVSDILTYTVALKNTGNVDAYNIVLSNTIPSSASLIPSSITVNGVTTPNINIDGNLALDLDSLAVNAVSTVQFSVTVNTIPNNNLIQNSSTIFFNYTVDPSVPEGVSGYGNTNIVTTRISQAIIDNKLGGGFIKKASVDYAKPGDTVTYTIGLKNTGNVSANNIILKDTIPKGTSLIPNSITLNGVVQSDTIPTVTVNVGSIASNAISTVQFKVLVISIPSVNPTPNNASIDFTFTIDPSLPNAISYGGNSNTASVDIRQAIIDNVNGNGFIKNVSATNATVNDILTYSIGLKNTGNTAATNVVLFDTVPLGTSFINNSVAINDAPILNVNPSSVNGIPVGTIAAGSTSTVTFDVKINGIPSVNPIPNSSTIKFNYTVNPANPNAIVGFGNSNTVNTKVNIAILDNTQDSIFKEVNTPYFVSTKNYIQYTVRLKNTGTIEATDVTLLGTIPTGTSFVPNSLAINNILVPDANPSYPYGFNLGTIPTGDLTTVTFSLVVDTIPSPNLINHSSSLSYKCIVDPSTPRVITSYANSNSTFNKVNEAIINYPAGGFTKDVDLKNARVGNTLDYNISIFNIGNVSANNVVFRDTIPDGTLFVRDSVMINGANISGYDPSSLSGINLGIIPPSTGITLSFKVVVDSVPYTNPIPNAASVIFKYMLDPSTFNTVIGYGNSNIVTTQINQASIDFIYGKGLLASISNSNVKLNDRITYTFRLKNTGNIDATNVVLTSSIPIGTSFVANSISLNGDILPEANILAPSGVNVGTLSPSAISTVTFDLIVTSLPPNGEIVNSATVKFLHLIDPVSPIPEEGRGNSNIVKARASTAIIDNTTGIFTKAVSSKYVNLQDIITYTFILKNTGNVTAFDVTLKDTIPQGLTFVNNSIKVNNSSINSTSLPSSGVPVGNISAGATSTVQFKALVSTIPYNNPMINTGYLKFAYTVDPSTPKGIISGGVSDSASVFFRQAIIDKNYPDSFVTTDSSKYSAVGDEVTYTITLKNVGNVDASSVTLKDTLPTGTAFVPDSLTLNGEYQAGITADSVLTLPIGTINPNSSVTVEFKVLVISLPAVNPVLNTPSVNFEYLQDPNLPLVKSGGNSNLTSFDVKEAIINGNGFVKSVSKEFADIDNILTYNILLQNTGNTPAVNVILFDTIVSEGHIVPNSVYLNRSPVPNGNLNYPNGLFIGTIPAGTTAQVAFDVAIDDIPVPNPIENSATVKFNFTVDPSLPLASESSGNSNIALTKINRAIINNEEFTSQGSNHPPIFTQSVDKEFTFIGDELTYTVVLEDTGSINALNVVLTETFPAGVSFVPGSVFINDNNLASANPTTNVGIAIGSLPVGEATTVTFKAKVANFTLNHIIETFANIKFNYKVNPNLPALSDGSGRSNSTLTTISSAVIDNSTGIFTEKVTPAYVTIGDVVTFDFNLVNTGNAAAYNVRLFDTLPDEIEFITNSVEVNGISLPGSSPNSSTGIVLNTIDVDAGLSVQFKAIVNKLPINNPLLDTSKVTFNYSMDPSLPLSEGFGESSQASLSIKQAIIDNANGEGFIKTADAFSTTDKKLTYSLLLKNTGNTNATNLIITDTIPEGFTFVNDSVFIDGFNITGANPSPDSGITITVLPKNGETNITFDVTVDTLPAINPASNDATVEFTYTVDPGNPNGVIGSGNSNSSQTKIILASIDDFQLTSSPRFVKLGDIVTYTMSLQNTGNAQANDITLTCTIPDSATFIQDSLYVNAENIIDFVPGPSNSLPIGNIEAGAISTVSFKVKINSIPDTNPIPMAATVYYKFVLDPVNLIDETRTGNSIIAYTQLNTAIIDNKFPGSFQKTTTPKYAKVDSTILYSLILKNLGNQSANNVVVIDTIPSGLKYIDGSLLVDGVSYPTVSVAPPGGLHIGTINPNEACTITFNATVITTPTPNPVPNSASVKFVYTVDPEAPTPTIGSGNSNISNLTIKEAIIDKGKGFEKTVDKKFLSIKDIVTYTVTLKNLGNTDANNIVFTDNLPSALELVPDSFKLNGLNIANADLSNAGINIGKLSPSSVATVVFSAVVKELPTPNTIENVSNIKFTYTIDPSLPNSEFKESVSNKVSSAVNTVDFNYDRGGFVLSSDKTTLKINEVITYTAQLTNLGNIPAYNVVYTTTIPDGASFVPYSVRINDLLDIALDPSQGVNLGTINPNDVVNISYLLKGEFIPAADSNIHNKGIISYDYYVDPTSQTPTIGGDISNDVPIPISAADISNPTGGFELTSDKEVVLIGDILTYNVVMRNNGNMTAYNVVLSSTVPNTASFVPGSVVINGVPSTDSPETGIHIGVIEANGSATVIFSLKISGVPDNGILNSDGTVTYEYDEPAAVQSSSITQQSITPKRISALSKTKTTNLSNLLKVRVISLKFGSSHTSNERYLDIGDTIEYQISVENQSNVDVENVIVQDTLPAGTNFVPNSFTINNSPVFGVNPELPYNIGNIPIGGNVVLGLKVVVVSIPSVINIFNTLIAKVNYTIKPIPLTPASLKANALTPQADLLGTSQETFISNLAVINNAYIGGENFFEAANKEYVTDDDIVTFTIALKNTGTVDAQNVLVTTTIPSGINLVPGSVAINNNGYPSITPDLGINIGTLSPNTPTTITYRAKVKGNSDITTISTNSKVTYGYIVNPSNTMKTATSSTNTVSLTYKHSNLIINKEVDATKANLKSPLTYTLTIKNIGNTAAENVSIKDLLDSSISFVPGSIIINGTPYTNFDITEGIDLLRIPANSEVTITFNALVTSPAAGYLISSTTDADYGFQVDPNNPNKNKNSQSNAKNVIALIYLNRTNEIPCNPLCSNATPCSICFTNVPMCCCTTLRSRVYSSEKIATAIECISTSMDIQKYKMWSQDSINHKMLINDPKLLKIQSVSAQLEVIRSSVITTPLSTIGNLEGKMLSGRINAADYIITFIVTYLNNRGQQIIKRGYKVISNVITINSDYFDIPMKLKGIIQDVCLTGFSNGILSLSASTLTYLTPTTESEQCVLSSIPCVSSGVENVAISENVGKFLTATDTLWNTVNVCSSEIVCSKDYISIESTSATVEILGTKKLRDTIETSLANNEGFTSSSNLLLVNMLLTVSINFIANIGSQYIKIPCQAVINLPDNDLPSDSYPISTCVENLYVGTIGTTVYASANIAVKTKQVKVF